MTWYSTRPGLEAVHLVTEYPWGDIGVGTVVDIGGSHGSISIAIARQFPSITCIVQDRPGVVADARAKLPQELTNRVIFMEHDFFGEQPVKAADVYFLRWVLHDWSNKYSIKILRSLIPALKRGAKILVNEQILPEPGEVSLYQERMLR